MSLTKKQVLNGMIQYLPDLRKGQFSDGDIQLGDELFGPKTVVISAGTAAKAGTTAGWVASAGDNKALLTCPAAQTAATAVVPLTGLPVGWTITGFKVLGQIESAGNGVTLDANLRRHTVAAADVADASVASITQVSAIADRAVNDGPTGLAEEIAANTSHYVLLTATTGASTDIAVMGIAVTIEKF